MKNRVTVLLLAGLMVIGSLSGCSSAADSEGGTPAQVTAEEEASRQAAEASRQAEEAAKKAEEEAARKAAEEAAAKEAEANTYYEAGRAYLYGLDGKKFNLESAHTNFEKAEELGKVEANFYLGVLCDWYNYPQKDYEMARAYYEKCGDDPYAQLALGSLYYRGQGVEEDKERAKELFQSVIDQGYVEGYWGIGSFSSDEEKYETALEDYIKASEGTEQLFIAIAMSNIGYLYDMGNGVEQDYAAAMEWYKKAADTGDAATMYRIGDMYRNGLGVEQDYAAAMEWLKKAADLGHALAMSTIGWMYGNGDGVKQDYTVAMEWFKKAADLGDADATSNIGYLYDMGLGVEQDSAAAMEWYLKAADLGNAITMRNIGDMYYSGDGVKQDYAAAMEWYKKAADLGNASAMNEIGGMYFNGYGVKQDYALALEWFDKAAELGNETAKENAAYLRQIMR